MDELAKQNGRLLVGQPAENVRFVVYVPGI
jgi:hypothetical protein